MQKQRKIVDMHDAMREEIARLHLGLSGGKGRAALCFLLRECCMSDV